MGQSSFGFSKLTRQMTNIMKVSILLVLLVAYASAEVTDTLDEFDNEFNSKILVDGDEEKQAEAKELKKAEDEINKENKKFAEGKANFEEKLYPFSDLTPEEFKREKTGLIPESEVRGLGLVEIPEEDRINTPEMQENLDLSEQYIIDCAYGKKQGYHGSPSGCNGAPLAPYTLWFKNDGGVGLHEFNYPYLGRTPKLNCNAASLIGKWKSGAKLTDTYIDYHCNENKMKTMVAANGAVMIGLHVSNSRGFNNYKAGVMDQCVNQRGDHAVLVVGYGRENGQDYWLVKNSWGANWGENGYIKIVRGRNCNNMANTCVSAKCQYVGNADPAPPKPTKGPVPTNLWCDMSRHWGNVNGNYRTRITAPDGTMLDSKIRCENGKCTPQRAGPTNACMYICGKIKC